MLAWLLSLDEVASNTLKVSSYRSGRGVVVGRLGPVWSLSEMSWQPPLARGLKHNASELDGAEPAVITVITVAAAAI